MCLGEFGRDEVVRIDRCRIDYDIWLHQWFVTLFQDGRRVKYEGCGYPTSTRGGCSMYGTGRWRSEEVCMRMQVFTSFLSLMMMHPSRKRSLDLRHHSSFRFRAKQRFQTRTGGSSKILEQIL